PKGPASIHRARAALDKEGKIVSYQFESKGFSRVDIATNESDPRSRSPTHKPHPDTCSDEFDDGEVVGVVLFEARGDGSEMLDLAEEPLDEVSIAVEEGTEGRNVDASRHGFDVRPGTAICQALAKGVAVIGTVGKQNLTGAELVEHIAGAFAVMRLALGEFERDRIAVGIDKGMDLCRQSAARAPHASGSSVVPFVGLQPPFLTFAAC